jgi:hypothetical protein
MDWKDYENEIFQHFSTEYPKAVVTRDVKIIGRYSKVERQVDVLIDETIAGFHLKIAVDAKHKNKPIDVKDVESFISFCSDIGAQKGVLISLNGYTPAAIKRAHYDDIDIEVDVLNFSDLGQFQNFGAIPFAGDNAALVPAPFGWIIDATRRDGMLATLYQRGLDFDKAAKAKEWMYINFWAKDETASSLDELIKFQAAYLTNQNQKAKISYLEGPQNLSFNTKIRCYLDENYPVPEYTGFIEFEDFIFFCVLFTPVELANRNLRKLEYILQKTLPIKVKNQSA